MIVDKYVHNLFVSLVFLLVSAKFNYTNMRYAFLYNSIINKICTVVLHIKLISIVFLNKKQVKITIFVKKDVRYCSFLPP